MNPNLVPTVIVNKNGVTTTVHRKASSSSQTSKTLPTVAKTSNETTEQLADKYLAIAEEMSLLEGTGNGRLIASEIRDNLTREYPADLVQQLKPFIEARDYTTTGLLTQLEYGPDMYSANELLDNLHYHELLGGDEYLQSSALTSQLSRYEDALNLRNPYRDNDQETQEKAVALMNFVRSFQRRDATTGWEWETDCPNDLLEYIGQYTGRTTTYAIRDKNLTEYIAANHKQVDLITKIVKERGLTRPEEIDSILNNEGHATLSNGVL